MVQAPPRAEGRPVSPADLAPGTADKAPAEPLPAAPTAPAVARPELPPTPPKPGTDTRPKRPTTRAARRAAAEANRAKKSTSTDARPKPATSAPRKATLETRLTGSLVSLGTVVAASGAMVSPALTADGVLICQHAPHVAAALDKVAQNDPRVKAALEKMLTAGVWSGLVAAMLPLVVGIAANHGAIPPHVAALLGMDAEQPAGPPGPVGPVGVV